MDRLPHTLLMLLVPFVLCGCSLSPNPEYPANRLRFDESLVGHWEPIKATDGDRDSRFEIKLREVDLRDGRVDSAGVRLSGDPPSERAKAYQVVFAGRDESHLEFDAFLFEAAGRRLCGLQVSEKQLAESGLIGVVMPMHHVVRVSLIGDELHMQWPKVMVVWMAYSGWVDAVPGARVEFDWRARQKRDGAASAQDSKPTSVSGIWLTSDIDRLIEIYEGVATDEEFWEEPEIYRRVVD